jgi:hypothetical protein
MRVCSNETDYNPALVRYNVYNFTAIDPSPLIQQKGEEKNKKKISNNTKFRKKIKTKKGWFFFINFNNSSQCKYSIYLFDYYLTARG